MSNGYNDYKNDMEACVHYNKEKFVEEIVQSEYEDAVHTNFHVPMETVVKRVAEQAWDAGAESMLKDIKNTLLVELNRKELSTKELIEKSSQ